MTQVWVGVLVIMRKTVQKIFPVRRFGRFYHRRYERRQLVLAPSIAMYIRSFVRRLRHKNSQSDEWISSQALNFKQDGRCNVTWIGHATFLIQIGGINILTDPIFGNATFLFRRVLAPTVTLDALPPIDYILISHNHRDHLDASSLLLLKKRFPDVKILVPYGDKTWFDRHQIDLVTQYFWWDYCDAGLFKFTFLPACHWSGRRFHDRNKSLWGSWMIEYEGQVIYFAGDTAYWKHFACIRHFFPSIDIAIMPIGPCEPLGYMRKSHLNADLAVKAFLELGAQSFIPMHWGTFYFGTDQFSTPINYLKSAWKKYEHQLQHKMLHILKFGEQLTFCNWASAKKISLLTD